MSARDAERAAGLAAALAHDVGKYLARIARNVPPGGDVPPALAAMLLADVFETHAGRPALARFDELAPDLAALTHDARLDEVRALLTTAASHERAARDGDQAALRALASLALAVESTLRALARDLRAGARP